MKFIVLSFTQSGAYVNQGYHCYGERRWFRLKLISKQSKTGIIHLSALMLAS